MYGILLPLLLLTIINIALFFKVSITIEKNWHKEFNYRTLIVFVVSVFISNVITVYFNMSTNYSVIVCISTVLLVAELNDILDKKKDNT